MSSIVRPLLPIKRVLGFFYKKHLIYKGNNQITYRSNKKDLITTTSFNFICHGSYEDAGVGGDQVAGGGLQGRLGHVHPVGLTAQSVGCSRDE
jgi:hypothetical protein